MKVALFSRYPSDFARPKGGVESVTVVLARALAALDDLDIHVVALEKQRSEVAVEHDDNVTIHRLPRSSWPEIVDIFVGPSRKRLIQYVCDLNPDILHMHETFGLALGNAPIPHVFTVHGFDHANLIADAANHAWVRSRLWAMAERHGLQAHKHIISITPYVRDMIESMTDAAIHDIDNPVDERFFHIERRTVPGRILCVGWINERKNTLGSVEAFARIAKDYPDARLVIAGEPKEEPEYFARLQAAIETHQIGERIEMLGHVNHVRLEEELAKARVFLLPSRQENAPMAIAEAMAAGVPSIVSDRCGMPYMVQEGQTGFLIDPESTEQIADRLARMLDSESLSEQMAEKGRQVAIERFHPRSVAEKTVAVYQQICAEWKRSPASASV